MRLKSKVWQHPDTKQIHIEINGFNLRVEAEKHLFYLLEVLATRSSFKDNLDQGIYINNYGELVFNSWDPWINKNAAYGVRICHVAELAPLIVDYLLGKWPTN